jgi:hypothetical protein
VNVRIDVTGGPYAGSSYEGPLADAPVTVLVPEGIVSARTIEQASVLRTDIAETLSTHQRMTISAGCAWSLLISRGVQS